MALDKGDADCTSGLSKEIYDKLKAMVESKTGWAELEASEKACILECQKDQAWIYAETLVDHIVANAEVKTVQVTDPVGTVETYVVGVGDHGGALVAGPNPVVGNVKKAVQTLDQTGSGSIL